MAKKKSNKKTKNKDRSRQSQPSQPFSDRRLLEKQLADVGSLLEGQQFESIEEANAFLSRLIAMGQPIPSPVAETPLEKAQELMYEAYEARGAKRARLARKALKLSEDCADAYVLLAEETARSPQEALELYEKGVRAAERVLGSEMFEENAGHFWGILETRPYMRARAGVASLLSFLDRNDEAIHHLQEMLRLNPGDNQGLRYFLATLLLMTKRDDDLSRLLQKYRDEPTAAWRYTAALLKFRQKGGTPLATSRLFQALEVNAHVPAYLLGQKRLPSERPAFVGLGDDNEAVEYVIANAGVWIETPGAMDWLARNVGAEYEDDDEADFYLDDDLLDEGFFGDDLDVDFIPFELDEWLQMLEIPAKEHKAIGRSLRAGVGAYSTHYYGRDRYRREAQELIDEQLELPLIFGYGAVAILNNDKIGDATKEKVVLYALISMRPAVYDGIPYGMLQMLGHLAQREQLTVDHLILGLLGLEFNALLTFGPSSWTDGVTSEAMIALARWIASIDKLSVDEKLWLAWMLTVNCDSAAHLGKAFANTWLDHPAIPLEAKRDLCWSWLEKNEEVGVPHPIWRLMKAYMAGDREEMERISEQNQLDLENFPLLPADEERLEDNFSASFRAQSLFLRSTYLKRLAVPRLIHFGEDLHTMIEQFWNDEDSYVGPTYKAGVADAIAEFHEDLQPDELRRLIERGVDDSLAQVRRPFYLLSTQFYGDEYMRRALDDNAASIRRWAAKKLA